MLIRNIWAVGRNYKDHAKELGNDVPTEPLFFLKAGSCLVEGSSFTLASWTQNVHHEIELALQFDSHLNVAKIALALDLTERSLQKKLKENGEPWTLAKSFTGACPISPLINAPSYTKLSSLKIQLFIDGQIKQSAFISDMIFPPAQLVEFAIKHFPICPYDLLLTGTPAGVGPIKKGQTIKATLGQLIEHEWTVL